MTISKKSNTNAGGLLRAGNIHDIMNIDTKKHLLRRQLSHLCNQLILNKIHNNNCMCLSVQNIFNHLKQRIIFFFYCSLHWINHDIEGKAFHNMNIFNEGTKSNYDSKLSCKFIRYLFVVQYTDGGFWVFSLCDSHVGFLFVPIYFHKLL